MHLQQQDEVRGIAIDYALATGLVMRHRTDVNAVVHAPFTLLPSTYPKECFERALLIQPLFNKLVHLLANDHDFIGNIMDELSDVDDFMKRTYDIYKIVRKKRSSQSITMGIHRSDYLLHMDVSNDGKKTPILQQVELNTIASSFSSLSTKVSELHRFNEFKSYRDYSYTTENLPKNSSIEAAPKALALAWKKFNNPSSVVMMVVQPGERNIFDQRKVEFILEKEYNVKLIRKTLKEIHIQGKIVDSNLVIDGFVVAVAYYRAGYSPTDYPTEDEWSARLLVEESNAIKCPNVAYHIVGSKKVQQVLSVEGALERYLTDPKEIADLKSCFTGLYPLDNSPAGKNALEMCLKSPENYVMKPQREGGGNNIYGLDIPPFVAKLSMEERKAYILMDLIKTEPMTNFMCRFGEVLECECISELGIYGIWVSDGEDVCLNETAGHLLRTKGVGTTEGGVATGFSVLDSPLLF